MEDTGAPQEDSGEAYALPPRRETFLAHYSRRSKMTTLTLTLVGLVALTYLMVHIGTADEPTKVAGHHGPKINSADHKDASPTDNAADTPEPSALKTGGGSNITNAQDDRSVPMAQAPDPDLVESTALGDLPRISEDGRQPWQIYARPFNGGDKRPRLAIIVADLGLSRDVTDAAVTRLPANVTLMFDAQSPVIGAWCGRARQAGHEVLLSVPMEPFDYPRSDPGAHTLLTTLSNSDNLQRLNWALRQGVGYVGITTMTGSRYTTDSVKMKQILTELKARGLMTLDTHVAPHSVVTDLAHELYVPVATVNERIEEDVSPEAIDAALLQLEQAAQLNGHAIGVVPPLPLVIDHVEAWLKNLPQHGIALAPVSAVVQ